MMAPFFFFFYLNLFSSMDIFKTKPYGNQLKKSSEISSQLFISPFIWHTATVAGGPPVKIELCIVVIICKMNLLTITSQQDAQLSFVWLTATVVGHPKGKSKRYFITHSCYCLPLFFNLCFCINLLLKNICFIY